jgi:transposase-like protein
VAETLPFDDHALQAVANLVAESLREELQVLTDALANANARPTLTVEQVALRLGVSRSTVYAHWREWGGYKLSATERAPIRFDATRLPDSDHSPMDARFEPASVPRRRRRRRLIANAPRMPQPARDAA